MTRLATVWVRIMWLRFLIFFVALAALAACTTLSEDQCRIGNWYEIGAQDGANGQGETFINEHAKACNGFGIAPVRSEWEMGRQEGLKLYCTPARAFDDGERGIRLKPVCPATEVPALRRANERGLLLHRINDEIRDIETDIRDIDRELATLPADDPRRSSLLAERRSLRHDLLRLRTRRVRLL